MVSSPHANEYEEGAAVKSRLDQLAKELELSGDFRVLRRFDPPQTYAEPDGSPSALGIVVDVETTGLSYETDRIIQLSLLPFQYGKETGKIFTRGDAINFFEDPGAAIPPQITALTQISDVDVLGKRIDDEAVRALLQDAVLIIAHNAGFDRPFLERRIPEFENKAWACSLFEVPWAENFITSAKLDYLLYRHCNEFFDGHRADLDCLVTLHVLATPFASGRLPFQYLLEAARQPTVRIWAEGTTVEQSTVLKSRRYRWNDGADGRPRAWFLDIRADQEAAEVAWLSTEIYVDRPVTWTREIFNAFRRYSKGF